MQPPSRARFAVKLLHSIAFGLSLAPPGCAGLEELCDVGSAAVVHGAGDGGARAFIFFWHLITWQLQAWHTPNGSKPQGSIWDPLLDSFQQLVH